jgi:hypothetical protein
MNRNFHLLALAGLAVSAAGLGGCASGVVLAPSSEPAAQMRPEEGEAAAGPAVESQDMVTVADRMARNILGIARIANAKSTPRIVLEPVANHTTVAINPDLFLQRIRILLNQKSMNRVRFLDRAMLAKLERERLPAPAPDAAAVAFRGADYLLASQFDPLAPADATGAAGTVLCSFRLQDAHTAAIIWEGSYEMAEANLTAQVAFDL